MKLIVSILFAAFAIEVIRKTAETRRLIPEWDKVFSKIWLGSIIFFGLAQLPFLKFLGDWYGEIIYIALLVTIYLLREHRSARLLAVALLPLGVVVVVNHLVRFIAPSFYADLKAFFESSAAFAGLWMYGFGIYATIQNNRDRKQRLREEEKIRQEAAKKAELEHLVVERTTELTSQKETLEKALAELKAAQAQLVHSEKMASLGELTAGIAHEIQNPLNFVNNFSELSVELAAELQEALGSEAIDRDLVAELVEDLIKNQEKINYHGKRASNIVTGMLQHARTSTGKKEPTDLNALADEYLRLSYHGLRAKDKSFNAKMVAEFDPAVGTIEVVAQDLGRVLLNLINNAFYAVWKKREQAPADYDPTVTVISRRLKPGTVEIRIKDNGTGIPDSLRSKIFQPFFTTKPTGQGTGLGLSLAYDIVTKGHGGKMKVESKEGEGTEMVITLPG
ncbi:MAG: hypothetical protein KDC61_01225 [Saprospiraceae bacterium]|nr:hypothetical protein [Saprospiraceae bacterium]MCB0543029.1 hypothetical protein [Saprospiraceae bacterium]MCB0573172.1 hypothetical protein [Saprospiraceae bacterium]MCB9355995.1 histidine kinase [Lewinellaceae bacterium]